MRITIRENNITVIEALKKVEKQSGLSIGYNNSLLRDKPALNLNLDKAGLDYSLSTILKGTGCTYELKGKYIKIIPQPAQEKPSSDKQIKGKVDYFISGMEWRSVPDTFFSWAVIVFFKLLIYWMIHFGYFQFRFHAGLYFLFPFRVI